MLQKQQVLQGRYQLQHILGDNAGRQTWLAVDLQQQASVVVKLLTLSDQVQWDQLRLFEREAQVLKALDHPRIPQYHDFFCLDDQLVWFALVQSYIDGPTLKQLLEQGQRFNEVMVRRLAEQLLEILTYLHGLSPPVLHRDIKPSNLMLKKSCQLYLIDFGAVQDRVAKEGATFTIVGTYGYTPLEQLGGRATPASDLYALGATLIHLLTGVAPADLPVVNGQLQFADTLKLNPGFVRWLWRLTEVNVELRFTSAREALQGLQRNATAIASTSTATPTAQRQLQKIPPGASEDALEAAVDKIWKDVQIANSNIQLQKSLHQLELSINKGRFGLNTFATYVRFDSQHFELCWRWLGLSRRVTGRITDIDHIAEGELQGRSKQFLAVSITIGVHEHLITSISPPLTKEERDWLLQELNHYALKVHRFLKG